MKSLSLVLVPALAVGLAACHRQNAPERTADAGATAPRAEASASPSTMPEDDTAARVASANEARREPARRPASAGPQSREPERRESDRVPEPPARGREPAGDNRVAQQEPAVREVTPPRPSPEPVVLPAGTEMTVELTQPVASDTSRPEDAVPAVLTEDVRTGGRVVLPAGAEVIGHVVTAQRSGRVKGRARLVLTFDEIRNGGRSYAIQAERWDVTAESSRGRDAKIAGGAAAAGAIIGAITGGKKGALKGGVIGGAAGGAAVLLTRGNEIELPARVARKITLRQGLRIE